MDSLFYSVQSLLIFSTEGLFATRGYHGTWRFVGSMIESWRVNLGEGVKEGEQRDCF